MDTDLPIPALLNYQPRGVLEANDIPTDLIGLDSTHRHVHSFRLTPQPEFRFIDETPGLEIRHG